MDSVFPGIGIPLLGAREREKIDIILRKFSTGAQWTQAAGSVSRAGLVQRFFKDLEKNGSWPEVKGLLVALRGTGAGDIASDSAGAAHVEPAHTPGRFSAEDIRIIRTRIAKMTQVEFAALLGVGERTLVGWELGERSPRGAVARRLRMVELGGAEALSQQPSALEPSADGS